MGDLIRLAVPAGFVLWLMLFVVKGSRPQRLGRDRTARSWSFLRLYRPFGAASAIAVAVPLGWSVGQGGDTVRVGLVGGAVGAAVVVLLAVGGMPVELPVGLVALWVAVGKAVDHDAVSFGIAVAV